MRSLTTKQGLGQYDIPQLQGWYTQSYSNCQVLTQGSPYLGVVEAVEHTRTSLVAGSFTEWLWPRLAPVAVEHTWAVLPGRLAAGHSGQSRGQHPWVAGCVADGFGL